MNVRLLGKTDLDAAIEVERETHRYDGDDLSVYRDTAWEKNDIVQAIRDGGSAYVAEDNGSIKGFAVFRDTPDHLSVLRLAISQDMAGEKLLDKAAQRLKPIHVYIGDDMPGLANFLRRSGYKGMLEKRFYNKKHDAIHFIKEK